MIYTLKLGHSEGVYTLPQMVTIEFHETLSHVLTQEGAQIALEGSHEARVWNALPMKGEGNPLTVQQLQGVVGKESASVGQGRAFKAKWIGKEGNGFVKLVCVDIGVWQGAQHSLTTFNLLIGRFD